MKKQNVKYINSERTIINPRGGSTHIITDTTITSDINKSSSFINSFIRFCFSFVLIVMLGSFFITGYNALDNKGQKIKETLVYTYGGGSSSDGYYITQYELVEEYLSFFGPLEDEESFSKALTLDGFNSFFKGKKLFFNTSLNAELLFNYLYDSFGDEFVDDFIELFFYYNSRLVYSSTDNVVFNNYYIDSKGKEYVINMLNDYPYIAYDVLNNYNELNCGGIGFYNFKGSSFDDFSYGSYIYNKNDIIYNFVYYDEYDADFIFNTDYYTNLSGLTYNYDISSNYIIFNDFYNLYWCSTYCFDTDYVSNCLPFARTGISDIDNEYILLCLIYFSTFFYIYIGDETSTPSVSYTYDIDYTHYDWSFKLKQLSNFKPLFYSQLFVSNVDTLNIDLQNALEVIQRKVNQGYIVYGTNVVLDFNKPFNRYTGLYTKDLYGPFWSKEDRQVITSRTGQFVMSHYTYGDDKVLYRRLDNINDTYESYMNEKTWELPQWLKTIIGVITFPIVVVQNFIYDLGVFFNFLIVW